MTNREEAKLSKILIEKVCNYQCLYDSRHVSYKSIRAKDMCWEKIGLECKLDGAVVKNKWKSLRDRYVRERKAEKFAEHFGMVPTTPKKEWVFYKYLSFLDPYLNRPEIQSIIHQNNSQSVKNEYKESPLEDSTVVVKQEFDGHFLDMHSYSKPMQEPQPPPQVHPPHPYVYILPAPATEPVSSSNLSSRPAAKKAKLSVTEPSPNNAPVSILKRRFRKFVNQHDEDTEEYTSDKVFVLSLVPSFQKLTEARKDKLKLDMHKLVYDAVYGSN